MVIDRERKPFAGKASPRALSDHHWRPDGIVILAGMTLTAVILAGPLPLDAPELAARRRTPPPQVSTPSSRRAALGNQTAQTWVRVPGSPAMVAHAGRCPSIPTQVVPMPLRGSAGRHGTSGHVRAS